MKDLQLGETTLSEELYGCLQADMLALADRNFFSYEGWQKAGATGAALVWRVKKNLVLPCLKRLEDGSYLSKVYPSKKARRHDTNGIPVRVIEYTLADVPNAEPLSAHHHHLGSRGSSGRRIGCLVS